MSAETNIETIQTIYEAFGKGDVETILGKLTDDIDWAAEASSDAAPWYGQRTGKDEVAKFFADIGGALDVSDFEPLDFTGSDTAVSTLIRFGFTVSATGKSGSMQIHHYWRFRDDKVEYYRGTEDTAQTLEALSA